MPGLMTKEKEMLHLEHPISKLNSDINDIKNRENAWKCFVDMGFPSKRIENWRYTDLASLYKKYAISQVKLGSNINVDYLVSLINLKTDVYNIVFIDGQLAYVDNIHGLNICHISKCEHTPEYADALDYLNIAAYLGGVVINVMENVKLSKPVLMTYLHTENSREMVVNYKHSITLQENSECLFFDHFMTLSDKASAANICTDVTLKCAAKCTYDTMANMNLQKLLITHKLRVSVEYDAQYETFQMGACLGLNRIDFDVDLKHAGAVFNAKGIYVVAHSAKVDYHFNVKHNASNTGSNVSLQGIVGGKSSATFNAKVYVAKGIKNVRALQNNRNIQLSKTAEINTKPELEIYSDDVVCSHGATIGQLDQQALFYLQSRGMNKDHASTLLIEGFVKELITLLDRDEKTITSYLKTVDGYIKHLF